MISLLVDIFGLAELINAMLWPLLPSQSSGYLEQIEISESLSSVPDKTFRGLNIAQLEYKKVIIEEGVFEMIMELGREGLLKNHR
jgi:hypothetical protein